MIFNIIILQCFLFFNFQLIETISSYSSFFNYWTCIGIKEEISFNKPYSIKRDYNREKSLSARCLARFYP